MARRGPEDRDETAARLDQPPRSQRGPPEERHPVPFDDSRRLTRGRVPGEPGWWRSERPGIGRRLVEGLDPRVVGQPGPGLVELRQKRTPQTKFCQRNAGGQ